VGRTERLHQIDRPHAPIVFDRFPRGYLLTGDRGCYAPPGLWFNADAWKVRPG